MKKGWLGIGILAAFLVLGLLVSFWMDRVHLPVEQLLQEAGEAAVAGDLEEGIALAKEAEALWSSSRKKTAAVADHSPMDEIDSLFRELWIYGEAKEVPHFAATSAALSYRVRAMADAHRLCWESLL